MHQTLSANGDRDRSLQNYEISSQTVPKSQLIRVKFDDEDNWKALDLDENERTGVNKRPQIHNRSESLTNIDQQSVSSLVRTLGKPNKETFSSLYPQREDILRKRDEEEPIQKEQYKISLEKSPYRRKTDFGPHFIVNNNNESVKELKRKEKKKLDNVPKIYSDLTDIASSLRFQDLSSQESSILTRVTSPKTENNPNVKQDNNHNSDRFDFNTWIPFLSNPYLVNKMLLLIFDSIKIYFQSSN
jgi:hypothetical protein